MRILKILSEVEDRYQIQVKMKIFKNLKNLESEVEDGYQSQVKTPFASLVTEPTITVSSKKSSCPQKSGSVIGWHRIKKIKLAENVDFTTHKICTSTENQNRAL